MGAIDFLIKFLRERHELLGHDENELIFQYTKRAADELTRLNKALTMAAYEEYVDEVAPKATFAEFMALPRSKEYIEACIQEWVDWYGSDTQR